MLFKYIELRDGRSRLLRVIAGAVCMICLVLPVSDAQAKFTTRAKQAILLDAETGAVLFQHNPDELVPPASMSKLMTLVVIFKALKQGQLSLKDEFVVSTNAWRTGGAPSRTSAMMVPINTSETLESLLQGIVVQSGNDACIAIAEGLSGTEAEFAKMMTRQAREIGLSRSTFGNSTGLPHPDQLMSMRELAKLARHLMMAYPDYYPRFAQREFRYRRHRFINRNPLLFQNIGVDGLKTGYLKASGYGIVASAKRGERRLIVAMSGLPTKAARKLEARKLLDYGFRNFAAFKIFDTNEEVGQALVWGGDKMYVRLVGQGEVKILLPRFVQKQKLKAEIIYNSPLKAPIKTGDRIATLRVVTGSDAVNDVPLFAGEDIKPAGFIGKGFDTLLYLAFSWVLS